MKIHQDNDFNDEKLSNLDSITVNRNPASNYEVANKKYVDNTIGENIILRFNQTLQTYLKVSVGSDVYHLTKYDEIQLIDTTEVKFPNTGTEFLQKWNIKCNNKINQSRINDFIKSTVTNSPTGESGNNSLPPIDTAFMYIETSSNNHGHECSFHLREKI